MYPSYTPNWAIGWAIGWVDAAKDSMSQDMLKKVLMKSYDESTLDAWETSLVCNLGTCDPSTQVQIISYVMEFPPPYLPTSLFKKIIYLIIYAIYSFYSIITIIVTDHFYY